MQQHGLIRCHHGLVDHRLVNPSVLINPAQALVLGHVVLVLHRLEDRTIATGNEIEIVNVLETAKEIVNVIGKEIGIDCTTSVIALLWIPDGGQEPVVQEVWIISHFEDPAGFLLYRPAGQIGRTGVEKTGAGLETDGMIGTATNHHLVDLLLGQ